MSRQILKSQNQRVLTPSNTIFSWFGFLRGFVKGEGVRTHKVSKTPKPLPQHYLCNIQKTVTNEVRNIPEWNEGMSPNQLLNPIRTPRPPSTENSRESTPKPTPLERWWKKSSRTNGNPTSDLTGLSRFTGMISQPLMTPLKDTPNTLGMCSWPNSWGVDHPENFQIPLDDHLRSSFTNDHPWSVEVVRSFPSILTCIWRNFLLHWTNSGIWMSSWRIRSHQKSRNSSRPQPKGMRESWSNDGTRNIMVPTTSRTTTDTNTIRIPIWCWTTETLIWISLNSQ